MPLSVSGFPEASRMPVGSETGEGESSDGAARTTSSPRLRSLFGAGGSGGTRTASPGDEKPAWPSAAATSNYSYDGDGTFTHSYTAPSSPSAITPLSFSPSLEPLSHTVYDLEAEPVLDMNKDSLGGKRNQRFPLSRKTAASPVRLGPSLTRLDIGAAARAKAPAVIPNKQPLPSVVIQEWPQMNNARWLAKTTADSGEGSGKLASVLPRDATNSFVSPAVASPKHGNESHKHVSAVTRSSHYPETHSISSSAPSTPAIKPHSPPFLASGLALATSSSVAAVIPASGLHLAQHSSATMNAVASSSRQINAVAGPSRPHADTVTSASSPILLYSSSIPTSKVLITQTTPQRSSHNQSLSMRYQPLVANYTSKSDSFAINQAPNLARPLPQTPSSSHLLSSKPTSIILPTFATSSLSGVPVGATIKRPRTTPGIITNLPTTRAGSSVHSTTLAFSPAENVSSGWASRQRDSSPLPISPSAGRVRSQSRQPKRDRSLDSYHSSTRVLPLGSRPASPVGTRSPRTSSKTRLPRRVPSPTRSNTQAVKHAASIDSLGTSGGTLALQTHIADVSYDSGPELGTGAWRLAHSQPPSPRAMPLKLRTRPIVSPSSPPASWILTSQPALSRGPLSGMPSSSVSGTTDATNAFTFSPDTTFSPGTTPPTTAEVLMEECEETCSVEAPMHSHPLTALSDDDEGNSDALGHAGENTESPVTPIEVYIDDMYSTFSRGPSPIRYARPDSRGNLSSSDDEDGGISSSSSSSSNDERSSPGLARRRLLRAYRMSYRPHEGGEPPHIPYVRSSPSPPPVPVVNAKKREELKANNKKKTRSYFGDYIGGGSSASIPTTRASSPERESRSRQPRKLASAMALALEEVRTKGSAGSSSQQQQLQGAPAPSVSPVSVRQKPSQLPLDDEVLDIRRTSPVRQDSAGTMDEYGAAGTSGLDAGQASSARSSVKLGWVKTLTRRRSEMSDDTDRVGSGGGGMLGAGSGLSSAIVSTPGNASAGELAVSGADMDKQGPAYSQQHAAHLYQHHRIDSRELEDLLLTSGGQSFRSDVGAGAAAGSEIEAIQRELQMQHLHAQQADSNGIGCFPTPSGSANGSNGNGNNSNARARLSDPSSLTFATAQTRTPSSSISIPIPGSPFTAFGIISRSKKTPKHTPTPSTSMASVSYVGASAEYGPAS